jgi:hypothetical protein
MPKGKKQDGPRLSKEEKKERDARAQYWMNQRKIERVFEGAQKSGWFQFSGELVDKLVQAGDSKLESNELVLIVTGPGAGEYRVHGYNQVTDSYTVRKIASYEEESVGSDT